MTIQLAGLILLACLSLGTLLGTTLAVQALQPNLRRQAEERRRLNAQWQEVREARQRARPRRCPRCGCRLR
ncbi:MAG TPA: hypothetical protein VGP04_02325 [Pseudonocardiaceae bacterium]|nr:hypothetical protein [Pseudonocardiaceae bacterium]